MKDYRMKKNLRRLAAALSVTFFAGMQGMSVGEATTISGNALPVLADGENGVGITTSGSVMTIAKGADSVIKWNDFSIDAGKTVKFSDTNNYL